MTSVVNRMCIQTREVTDRVNMYRLIVSGDEVVLDSDYKLQGRSVYIQKDNEIISKFLKRKKLPIRLDEQKQLQIRKILSEINEQ